MIQKVQILNSALKNNAAMPADSELVHDDDLQREFSEMIRKVRHGVASSADELAALAGALSQITPAPVRLAHSEPAPQEETAVTESLDKGQGLVLNRTDKEMVRSAPNPVRTEKKVGLDEEGQPAEQELEEGSEVELRLLSETVDEQPEAEPALDAGKALLVKLMGNQRGGKVSSSDMVVEGDVEQSGVEEVFPDQQGGNEGDLQLTREDQAQGVTQQLKRADKAGAPEAAPPAEKAEEIVAPVPVTTQPVQAESSDEKPSESLEITPEVRGAASPLKPETPVLQAKSPNRASSGDQMIQGLIAQQQAALTQTAPGSGARESHAATTPRAPLSGVTGAESMNSAGKARDNSARTSRTLPRALSTRLLERVEAVLKEAVKSKDGKTLTFRIEPGDLGKIKVAVSLREGSLHARLTPENKQVVEALRDRAGELQTSLRKLGLDVDSVTVTVSSDTGGDLSTPSGMSGDGQHSAHDGQKMPGKGAQRGDFSNGSDLADHSENSQQGQPLPGGRSADGWVA